MTRPARIANPPVAAESDGDGGSFLPAVPFLGGETVRVVTQLRIVGGRRGTFSFQIADAAPPLTGTAGSSRRRTARSRTAG